MQPAHRGGVASIPPSSIAQSEEAMGVEHRGGHPHQESTVAINVSARSPGAVAEGVAGSGLLGGGGSQSHFYSTSSSTVHHPRPSSAMSSAVLLFITIVTLLTSTFLVSSAADEYFSFFGMPVVPKEGDLFRSTVARRELERRMRKWRSEAERDAKNPLDFETDLPDGLSIRAGRLWVENDESINKKAFGSGDRSGIRSPPTPKVTTSTTKPPSTEEDYEDLGVGRLTASEEMRNYLKSLARRSDALLLRHQQQWLRRLEDDREVYRLSSRGGGAWGMLQRRGEAAYSSSYYSSSSIFRSLASTTTTPNTNRGNSAAQSGLKGDDAAVGGLMYIRNTQEALKAFTKHSERTHLSESQTRIEKNPKPNGDFTEEEWEQMRLRSHKVQMSVDGLYPSYMINGEETLANPRRGFQAILPGLSRVETRPQAFKAIDEQVAKQRLLRFVSVLTDLRSSDDADGGGGVVGGLSDTSRGGGADRSYFTSSAFMNHPLAPLFGSTASYFLSMPVDHPPLYILNGDEVEANPKRGFQFPVPADRAYPKKADGSKRERETFYDPLRRRPPASTKTNDNNNSKFDGYEEPKNGKAVVAPASVVSPATSLATSSVLIKVGGNGNLESGYEGDFEVTLKPQQNTQISISTTNTAGTQQIEAAGEGEEPLDENGKDSNQSSFEKSQLKSPNPNPAVTSGITSTTNSNSNTNNNNKILIEGGKGFEAKLDLFPDFGFDKSTTEIVRVNNFRDGVYYNVPVSRSALDKKLAEGGGPNNNDNDENDLHLSHYKKHGLPYRGSSFITSNEWKGKCFYEAHNFCVLNGTLTFFHNPAENPNVAGGSLRMCTEFSQRSPTIRLKYETRPLPADGVLPAPLMTKTPGWIVQYWCQDLFHMTLTMLPAYQTLQKEFPKILANAGILEKKGEEAEKSEGDGNSEQAARTIASRWSQASGGGHDGKGPVPAWWFNPTSQKQKGDLLNTSSAAVPLDFSPHYPINDGKDIVHPDVFVRIAKGKRKKSAHCRVKLGDPRHWEDVRNSKWGDKQFPIAGNPYWPFYQTLTSQPDRIYPLYRGATAKSACYTNGIIDKYYIKNMMGEEARGYTKALVDALGIKSEGSRGRKCGKYRLTLIDRRGRTRRLTNIPEIAAAAANKGFSVQAVALETLPIRKQLELIAATDVLLGMHGNGITWLQFLPPGSAVVELVGVWYTPYALLWGHKHFHSSMRNNMAYKEGGEFRPFAHNVTEIEELLDKVRAYLDTTSCRGGTAPPMGQDGGGELGIDFKPPNERLENLYKDCVPHC